MAFLVLSLCSHDLVISRHFLKHIILGSRSHQVCFSYFCILDSYCTRYSFSPRVLLVFLLLVKKIIIFVTCISPPRVIKPKTVKEKGEHELTTLRSCVVNFTGVAYLASWPKRVLLTLVTRLVSHKCKSLSFVFVFLC